MVLGNVLALSLRFLVTASRQLATCAATFDVTPGHRPVNPPEPLQSHRPRHLSTRLQGLIRAVFPATLRPHFPATLPNGSTTSVPTNVYPSLRGAFPAAASGGALSAVSGTTSGAPSGTSFSTAAVSPVSARSEGASGVAPLPPKPSATQPANPSGSGAPRAADRDWHDAARRRPQPRDGAGPDHARHVRLWPGGCSRRMASHCGLPFASRASRSTAALCCTTKPTCSKPNGQTLRLAWPIFTPSKASWKKGQLVPRSLRAQQRLHTRRAGSLRPR